MKLQDLTDPLVRALLDPDGCEPHEWVALVEAGLGRVSWSEPDERNMCSHVRSRSDDGDRLLDEAQCFADGLTSREIAKIRDAVGNRWSASMMRRFEGLDLLRRASSPIGTVAALTPLGRLVLALRDQSKAR